MWATSVIFKKLPKANNHPLGENDPNLVTLDRNQRYIHMYVSGDLNGGSYLLNAATVSYLSRL
jgi:hypothetical protein